MAGKPRMTVEGDEELARALDEAKRKLADLTEAHREMVGPLLNRSRAEAPVLTGALAESLYPAAGPKAFGIQSALIYAPPIHFGWPAHGITANPFLINARNAMEGEAVKGYERHISKLLDEVTSGSKH